MTFGLSKNAIKQFNDLYCLHGEDIHDAFKRVSKEFATNNEEEILSYNLLAENIWRPNTPVWLNAGTNHKIFSACFPAGSLVKTENGLIPIEQIDNNDRVLTHNNKFMSVTKTMEREYDGYLYNINAIGIPDGLLRSTDEHPYYIIDKDEFICVRKKTCKCNSDIAGKRNYCYKLKNWYKDDCVYKNGKKFNVKWKKAEELNTGDYLTISFDNTIKNINEIDLSDYINKEKYNITDKEIFYQKNNKVNRFIQIDEDFMLLMGYYLAEGSCGRKGGDIRFTFSLRKDNEIEFCKDVIRILEDKFGLNDIRLLESELSGTRCVRKCSIVLGHFFRKIFGDRSTNKKIPEWMMMLPINLQEQLLIGLFRGDGFHCNGYVKIALANFELIHQTWELLMRCGMFFLMGKVSVSSNITWNYTQPYELRTRLYYVKDFAKKIWIDLNKIEKPKHIQKKYFKYNNYFATKITSINKKEFNNIVYNLEVEQDNTYTIMNVNVHNCFVSELKDSMDSIYDVSNVARKIFQFGSGIGIPIGNLRESEAYIYEGKPDMIPEGRTSGPLTFMKLFDAVAETTKSGGKTRRAAILCLMLIWHPDIMDFIKCKQIDGNLSNMNISIGVTDKFMQCLEDKVPFNLLTPYDGSKVGEIDPQELWNQLSTNAYAHAEPGVIFIDTVNKWNPLIKKILIECCNPCIVGNTKIMTNKGEKSIYEIYNDWNKNNINYKILTYNFNDEKIELDIIDNVFLTRKDAEIYEIELENGEILQVTPDHKVYVENKGWIKTKNIETNDIIKYINYK